MAERLTKAERREIAREKARQLQEEQAKREKRNRLLMIGGITALVLIVALAVVAIIQNGSKSYLDGVDSPAGASNRGGISIGESLEAGTVNEGAPEVNIYSDYTCSYCALLDEINESDLKAMAEEGLITMVLHPVALLDQTGDFSGYSALSTNAVATVANDQPEAFLAFHNALFQTYRDLIASGATVFPDLAGIKEIAVGAGVSQDVADSFADNKFIDWVEGTTRQFTADGYRGTPTVIVDGTVLDGEWQTEGAIREMITTGK